MKCRIIEEHSVDHYLGPITMYRIQKKILGLFWFDIGGGWTHEEAQQILERYAHPEQTTKRREIIAEYEI